MKAITNYIRSLFLFELLMGLSVTGRYFFKRKFIFEDEDGQPFDDNPDRMVFFCKGVIETVKKFGWPPDTPARSYRRSLRRTQ